MLNCGNELPHSFKNVYPNRRNPPWSGDHKAVCLSIKSSCNRDSRCVAALLTLKEPQTQLWKANLLKTRQMWGFFRPNSDVENVRTCVCLCLRSKSQTSANSQGGKPDRMSQLSDLQENKGRKENAHEITDDLLSSPTEEKTAYTGDIKQF